MTGKGFENLGRGEFKPFIPISSPSGITQEYELFDVFAINSALEQYSTRSTEYNGIIGLGRKTRVGGSYNPNIPGWQIQNYKGQIDFLTDKYGKAVLTLYDTGNLYITGHLTEGSDRRWKDNIDYDAVDTSILENLKPVEWDWKEEHGKGHGAGFIAQDVKEVLPYAVEGSEENGYLLNYSIFHAFEVKAIQELKAENKALREEIELLKEMIKKQ